MVGTLLDGGAIFFGAVIGRMFRRVLQQVPQRSCFQILGIAVSVMAITGLCTSMLQPDSQILNNNHLTAIILSFIIGAVIGELCRLEARTTALSVRLEGKAAGGGSLVAACLSGSTFFIVGALQLTGPINSALLGDNSTLFTKAVIDFPFAVVFGAAFGFGTALSAIPVMLVQVLIGLFAKSLAPVLTSGVVSQINAVGYIILLCLGLNLLFDRIVKINTVNLIPSVGVVLLFHILLGK